MFRTCTLIKGLHEGDHIGTPIYFWKVHGMKYFASQSVAAKGNGMMAQLLVMDGTWGDVDGGGDIVK